MRRSLLIDNNIQLPVDVKVYADRKFSHTVMTYAKKVSIIPDCVYLWRIRSHVIDESLSMRRKETWNYIDRIESFKSDLNHFTNFYKDYFKSIFNMATLPFYWSSIEPKKGELRYDKNSEKYYRRPPIDLCMEYCEENKIEPREHALAYEHLGMTMPAQPCGECEQMKIGE